MLVWWLKFVDKELLVCCCEIFCWVDWRFLILFRGFFIIVFNCFLFLYVKILLLMLLKLLEFCEFIFVFCIGMIVWVVLEFVFVELVCFIFCFWFGGGWWGVMVLGFEFCCICSWVFVMFFVWWCLWGFVVCFWWLCECVFCMFWRWVL